MDIVISVTLPSICFLVSKFLYAKYCYDKLNKIGKLMSSQFV